MRILVTNDDGIEAPGLVAAASALVDAGHDVVVGAPTRDFSGSGSGLGPIDDGSVVAWREHRLPGVDCAAYALDAPPSFVVLAFCSRLFGPPPDLVVAGINDGYNTGRLVLASSTVGAALTATTIGVGSIAISTAEAPHHRYDTAAAVLVAVVRQVVQQGRRGTCLNVNVPPLDVAELAGVEVGGLARRGLMGLGLERGDDVITLRRYANDRGIDGGTDAALVGAGYVAVTALTGVTQADHGPAGDAGLAAVVDAARAHLRDHAGATPV
ncbi:5'/3'-nucleotidase SurE [Nocardioides zeae]|uniref:5'-nucleotidase n=1 Tax=Nocardioides zeae TaxID=1457234 RepID=A0A6P0HQM5_9ACTN|nr:5'/3'-nucleotidase SurE [Nocardioides zeae]